MDKETIRKFASDLGVDAVGFTAVEDYKSTRSPALETILPGVRSLVVLGYRELNGSLDGGNPRICMASRMGVMEVGKTHTYLLGKFIEENSRSGTAVVPFSYPLDMDPPGRGLVADVSLRHAAVAAGLGVFGRHNLVIHPRYGTRMVFTAVLTQLPLPSDPPVTEKLCDDCGICVKGCPAGALNEEGRTDDMRCLRHSQPYGIGGLIGYLRKMLGATPEERKGLLMDPLFLSLYQASFIGFQYQCFRCFAGCPAVVKKRRKMAARTK